MNTQVVDWLLEESDPSIRYRTLTELLDTPEDDAVVQAARAQIADSKPVRRIFAKMHPDGYWAYQGCGQGIDYKDYFTTHFDLAFLAELGLTRDDPRIARAVERYLGFQQPDGDFLRHFSCLYSYNLRTLVMLGYRDDPRTQKIAGLMIASERPDGGTLCDMHEGKYKTKVVKSCMRGSLKTLLGFAMLPDLWDTPRCRQLVSYFLRRRVYFRMSEPDVVVKPEFASTNFPFTWRGGLLDSLYALSVMGYSQHPALAPAWTQLDTKRDDEGRYRLDWRPTNSYFNPGKRGEINKWVTLYAALALKHRAHAPAAV